MFAYFRRPPPSVRLAPCCCCDESDQGSTDAVCVFLPHLSPALLSAVDVVEDGRRAPHCGGASSKQGHVTQTYPSARRHGPMRCDATVGVKPLV